MVNADFMNVLNTALVALTAKYGVPMPSAGMEQYLCETCVVRFPKDVANTHRDNITAIVKEMSRIDGIRNFGDSRYDDVFRGNETRDVYFDVRRKHWHKNDYDRQWEEEYDKFIDGDPEITAKYDAEEKAKKEERRKYYKEYLLPIPSPSPTKPTELYLTMAYEPYDAIKSGEKVTEFRAYCESWVKRILANMGTLRTVKFQRGYGGPGRPKPEQMIWTIKNIELYDIETRESSDPINVKEGFIPTHIAIDLGVRMDDAGPSTQKDN